MTGPSQFLYTSRPWRPSGPRTDNINNVLTADVEVDVAILASPDAASFSNSENLCINGTPSEAHIRPSQDAAKLRQTSAPAADWDTCALLARLDEMRTRD
jgi:hypothetical protein